jgi:hypothetical protein
LAPGHAGPAKQQMGQPRHETCRWRRVRERPSSSALVRSTYLNLRKNKDKSERMVTCFVRVPGMYEAGPRYRLSAHTVGECGVAEDGVEPAGDDDAAAWPRVVARARLALPLIVEAFQRRPRGGGTNSTHCCLCGRPNCCKPARRACGARMTVKGLARCAPIPGAATPGLSSRWRSTRRVAYIHAVRSALTFRRLKRVVFRSKLLKLENARQQLDWTML